jgi:hypothetical protein
VCGVCFSVPYLHLQSQVYSKRGTEGWCGKGPGGGGGGGGGWAQFDWMLGDGSQKAQPIRSQLVCFNNSL